MSVGEFESGDLVWMKGMSSESGEDAGSIRELREELSRARYESSILLSTETLLESKCAALDSRLEEALTMLRQRESDLARTKAKLEVAVESEGKLKRREIEMQELVRRMQDDAREKGRVSQTEKEEAIKEAELAKKEELQRGNHVLQEKDRIILDMEQALELQARATSAACQENEALYIKLMEVEGKMTRSETNEDILDQLRRSLADKDLYISSLESKLEKLDVTCQNYKSKLASIETEGKRIQLQHENELARMTIQHQSEIAERENLTASLRRQLEDESSKSLSAIAGKENKVLQLEQQLGEWRKSSDANARTRIVWESALSELEENLKDERSLRGSLENDLSVARQALLNKDIDQKVDLETLTAEKASIEKERKYLKVQVVKLQNDLRERERQFTSLEATLVEMEKAFRETLALTNRRLGTATDENNLLRQSIVQCESLVSSSLDSLFKQQHQQHGFPTSSTDRNDDGPLLVEMLTEDPSNILSRSQETLYLRKLRNSQKPNRRRNLSSSHGPRSASAGRMNHLHRSTSSSSYMW